MSIQFSKTQAHWLIQSIKNSATDSCLLWPHSLNPDGYGKCQFNGKWHSVHRIVFFLTHGRWPKPCARHTCDVRNCFNPRHIIEGTHIDNMHDKAERNMEFRGVNRPFAKIDEETVRKIRAEYVPWKVSTTVLAKKYGLNNKNIWNIIARRAWRHVE